MEVRGIEPLSETRIDFSVYVRIPLIEVSVRWPTGSPRPRQV